MQGLFVLFAHIGSSDPVRVKGILARVANLKNILCTCIWGMFLTLIWEGVPRRDNYDSFLIFHNPVTLYYS